MATILVVDNRPTNREVFVTLLGYSGHRVLEAADGAAALEVVRSERPHLVITDIGTLAMDGYEFVRQLLSDPAVAQTPIIFYTAAEAYALARAYEVLRSVAEALALVVSPAHSFSLEEFHQEYPRIPTNQLSKQVEALEHEVAERKRTEEALTERARLATLGAKVGIAQLTSLALTNAKLFEKLEQANRLKDDILASVSHELRSPLQSIMGFTELALEGVFDQLTAQQSMALQKVQKAANQELRLVNSLLQVSQLGGRQLPVLSEAVDVAALMEDLREETSQLPTKPTVRVEWRIPPRLPPLHTDRMKLNIVLQNLLSNAVKFTEQGSVIMSVYPSDGGMEFRVTDTGIGIAPEVQRVMFEMFRQGDGSSTRHYGGVGLGLYIVRRMMDLLEGTVTVESEVGRGSTFRAWVPPFDATPP